MLNIENSVEPCRIPSKKNLEEITQVFAKISPLIQDCIIAYLEDIDKTLIGDFDVKDTLKLLLAQKVNSNA